MNRSRYSVCLAAALVFAAPSLRAQQQVTIPTPVVPALGPTLAQALAQAQPPQTLYLTVGADKIQAPSPPAAGASVADIADAYSRVLFSYGDVTGIAPPQMTLVYSPPDTPNPYDGMPPKQVMQLLTQTFSAAQWKQFMGTPGGIGYTDMQTPMQRQLFGALFPGGHLVIVKNLLGDPNAAATKQDLSGDVLMQAHLRLGFLTSLALQMTDNPDNHLFAETVEPAGTPARYFMMNDAADDADKEYGAPVRETSPNALKQSDFSWNMPALAPLVSLHGVKTVDDLVAQIAAATHLEIYADPRYGSRSVTLLGPATGATAGDLLRALAACVTGTYRKVGPAYVLTDDLTGIGTKHVQWKAFEAKAQAMLPTGGYGAPPQSQKNPYTVQDIPWDNDPMAMTPAEQKQFWTQWRHGENPYSNGMLNITLPFDQLSPVQQDVARQELQLDQTRQHANVTLGGTVMVQAEPELEITLPSLDGPVIVFQSYQDLLPYPTLTPAEQKAQQQQSGIPMPGAPANAYPGPLRPQLRQFTRSAVMIAPKTASDAATEVADLGKLGFTEAWVKADASVPHAPALLAAAVKAGRSSGIAVFADVTLLAAAPNDPAAEADLDILGLTPAEAAKDPDINSFPFGAKNPLTPFAPDVAARLTAWVTALGKVPGLAGMVWPDPPPPGYSRDVPNGMDTDRSDDALGYADAGRLAFLRWKHADPVDVYTNSVTDERAHVVAPSFNDNFHEEESLYDAWRGLRANVYQTLMQRLAAALPPAFHPGSQARLPLLVAPSNGFADLIGSWDNWTQPPPDETFDPQLGPDGQPLMGVPSIGRMASTLTYNMAYPFASSNAAASLWASAAANALSLAQRKGDKAVVIDASARPALLEALLDRDRQMTPGATSGTQGTEAALTK